MRQNLKLPASWDGNLWHYRNQGRMHAMHHHAELEFNLVTQGRGLYLLENRKHEIRRGDLLWLFPAQEHVLIEQTLDFEMWIGVFKPKAVRRLTNEKTTAILRQANPSGDYRRRLSEQELHRLQRLLSDIAESSGSTDLLNAGLGFALLHAWQLFERAANVPVHDVHPAVERAAHLIRSKADLKLEEIASRSGLSRQRLSRLFKQQTGTALVDFRNRQRIEKFLQLYGTGQRITTLDAAFEAGFGSYPQFHRVFKRVMGYPPRKHRRNSHGR